MTLVEFVALALLEAVKILIKLSLERIWPKGPQ